MKHIYTKLTFVLLLLMSSISLFANSSKTYYSTMNVAVASGQTGYGTVYVTSSGKASDTKKSSSTDSSVSHSYNIVATPSDGYKFTSWSGSGITFGNTNAASTTGSISTSSTSSPGTSKTATASFKAIEVNSATNPDVITVTKPSTPEVTVSFSVTNGAKTSDFTTPTVTGTGWSYVANSLSVSGTAATVKVKFTATVSTPQNANNGTVTLTSKEAGGSNKAATLKANVDLTPTLTANPTSLDFGMFTIGVDKKTSKTIALTFSNGVTFDKTADANIAPFSASLSSDNKTLTVYYEPTSVGTGTWSKTLTVTAKNGQATTLSASQTITLTGQAQSTTHPEYTCTIADSYFVDDAAIDLNTLWTSTSPAAKKYEIVSFTPLASAIHTGATAPTISGTSLSLGQAGELKLKLSQSAAPGFFDGNSTKTIIINKKEPNFILSKNTLELDQTATLTLENTNGANVVFSPTGKVSYVASTGVITATEVGTTQMTISQSETYKLSAKSQTFPITVSKKTPTLTVKMGNVAQTSKSVAVGNTVAVTFDKVSDTTVVVTPKNQQQLQYASFVNDTLTAHKVGSATFRATLPETETYKETSVEFTLNVTANVLHLPITMSSSLWNNTSFKVENEGSNSWNNTNGIVLGSVDGGGFDSDDKYVILHFEGIPDKLTFEIATPSKVGGGIGSLLGGVSNVEWYVKESKTSTMPSTTKWNSTYAEKEFKSYSIQLDPDTRYVQLCYSGNFGAYFHNVQISELKKVEDPTPNKVDFGTAEINSGVVEKEVNVNWWNIAPMTVTCDNSRFTVTPQSFGNYEKIGSQTINVSFNHTSDVGEYTGTITISNGDASFTKTIPVSAKTTKHEQHITWNENLESTGFAMNVGETYPDNTIIWIAKATNRGTINYTSDKTSIIRVINDTILEAVGVGTARIIAKQDGDDEFQEVSDTVSFVVTDLRKQKITWNQDFSGLLTNSNDTTLTARAESGCDITYSLSNDTVVSIINDSILHIIRSGEVVITATQSGCTADGVQWLEISQNNYVIVRDPNEQCKGYAVAVSSLELNSTNNFKQEYEIHGVPVSLTFSALHGTKPKPNIWTSATYAPLVVEEYVKKDGVWKWINKYNEVVGTSSTPSGTIALSEGATKIRFSTTEDGTTHTIEKIYVTRMKQMSSSIDAIHTEIEANTNWSQRVTIAHSNIDFMNISTKKGLLTLSTTTLGEGCNDYTDDEFTISFNTIEPNKEFVDTVVITDNKQEPATIVIPVYLKSKGLNQSISDFVVSETAYTTDSIAPFNASVASGLPVTYSTSDSTIARIVNGNELEILTAGTVTVRASQAGDATHNATYEEKTLVISKVTPTIDTYPTTDVHYLGTWDNSQLTKGKAIVTFHGRANTQVEGTFEWTENNGTQVVNAPGNYPYYVTFKPTDTGKYNVYTFDMPVTIKKAIASLEMNDGEVTVSIPDHIKTIDLNSLKNSASDNGSLSYSVISENNTFATVNGNLFSATAGDEYTILATKAETNVYEQATDTFTVTVNKITPVVSTSELDGVTVAFGEALSTPTLSEKLVATDNINNVTLGGEYAWKVLPIVGDNKGTAIFTPQDTTAYTKAEFEIELSVEPIETTYSATAHLIFGRPLSDAVFTNTTKGILDEDVEGTIQWAESVDATATPLADTYTNFAIAFTPADGSNYVSGIGTCVLVVEQAGIIFEGDAENNTTVWGNEDNWLGNQMPTEEDFVVINANVDVTTNVSIAGLTINQDHTLTIKDGGSLTIGNNNSLFREAYGNIIVEAGGQLNLGTGTVELNDFTLYASASGYTSAEATEPVPGKSGQVSNEQQLTIHNKAYFVLDLDPSGAASYGWYDFTVPFPVDALHGITRQDPETGEWLTLTNETHYAIMKYHEDLRAQGQYGWKKYTQTLQPGVAYTMTTNSSINRYRFEMTEGSTFNNNLTIDLQATEGGLQKDKGWNGVGNGTMTYVTLMNAPLHTVQMYNHARDMYKVVDASTYQFVIGSAYFVQAEVPSVLTMQANTEATPENLRAPERTPMHQTGATLTISQPNSNSEADRIILTADEDATSEYVIGKDLLKMGTMSKSLEPRIWSAMKPAGILCGVYAPMTQNEATVPFKIYTPKAGTYTFSAVDSQAESVYLMRNGVIVWNLSMSDYVIDLPSGLNTEYSIRLVAQGMDAATGVDYLNNDDENGTIFVEKMIVDGQLFILRDGILYDAQGRKVER